MSNWDEAKGRVKEAVGDLKKDDDLKAEGKTDQAAGKVKDAVDKTAEKVKETFDKATDRHK
jgi:uncharacterized protein YjbJ (UPF0337 family)